MPQHLAASMGIGDFLTLPSGRRVRVMCAADPARPWAPLEVTPSFWHICRAHGIEGHGGVSHYFSENRPLQLDEVDAVALAKALNRVRAG